MLDGLLNMIVIRIGDIVTLMIMMTTTTTTTTTMMMIMTTTMRVAIPITKGGMRVMRAAASCHQLSTAPRLRMIMMINIKIIKIQKVLRQG